MLHFHRLGGGSRLFFGCHCLEVARSHVYKGSMMSAELLSHPCGTWHACGGGQRLRTGCAHRRLVSVQPSVVMQLADVSTVLRLHSLHCAAPHHLQILLLTDRSLGADAFRAATDAPHLRIKRRASAPHSTQRSTRAAHTQSEEDLHTCIVIYEPCNQNGEICSRAVRQQ